MRRLLFLLTGAVCLGANGFQPYAGWIPEGESNRVVVWQNANVNDIRGMICKMNGAWMNGEFTAHAYIYDRTPSSFTAQFQSKDGGYAKATKVIFRQASDNVEAWAIKSGSLYGYDYYGTMIPEDRFYNGISSSPSNGAYGVYDLEVVEPQTLDTDNPPEAVELEQGVLSLQVPANGATVATAISGEGVVEITAPSGGEAYTVRYDEYLTYDNVVVIPNAHIDAVTVTGGVLNNATGGWGFKQPVPADVYRVSRGAGTMTFQLQAYTDGWLKGVQIILSQQGKDVVAKAEWAAYTYQSHPLGCDLYAVRAGLVNATKEAYGIEHLFFTVDPSKTGLILSGEKSWAWGDANTLVDGATVTVAEKPLPNNRRTEVRNGGVLRLCTSGGVWNSIADHRVYYVDATSTLQMNEWLAIAAGAQVIIDGGTLEEFRNASDYLNDLTVMNGGRVVGKNMELRMGYISDAVCHTAGDQPIVFETGIRLFNRGRVITFDTEAETTIQGVLNEETSYAGATFAKAGSATLTLAGASSFTGGIRVGAGTLRLVHVQAVKAANAVTLSGGTLAVAAAGGVAAGALTLPGDATLDLAAGAAIEFADSSAAEWTGHLTVTAPALLKKGSRLVRFGDSAAALTAEQLKRITLDGFAFAALDEDGWLYGKNQFTIRIQ